MLMTYKDMRLFKRRISKTFKIMSLRKFTINGKNE